MPQTGYDLSGVTPLRVEEPTQFLRITKPSGYDAGSAEASGSLSLRNNLPDSATVVDDADFGWGIDVYNQDHGIFVTTNGWLDYYISGNIQSDQPTFDATEATIQAIVYGNEDSGRYTHVTLAGTAATAILRFGFQVRFYINADDTDTDWVLAEGEPDSTKNVMLSVVAFMPNSGADSVSFGNLNIIGSWTPTLIHV